MVIAKYKQGLVNQQRQALGGYNKKVGRYTKQKGRRETDEVKNS